MPSFAAGAAHIGAMYTAFLSVAMACGTPGLMAALALGRLAHMHALPCARPAPVFLLIVGRLECE